MKRFLTISTLFAALLVTGAFTSCTEDDRKLAVVGIQAANDLVTVYQDYKEGNITEVAALQKIANGYCTKREENPVQADLLRDKLVKVGLPEEFKAKVDATLSVSCSAF